MHGAKIQEYGLQVTGYRLQVTGTGAATIGSEESAVGNLAMGVNRQSAVERNSVGWRWFFSQYCNTLFL